MTRTGRAGVVEGIERPPAPRHHDLHHRARPHRRSGGRHQAGRLRLSHQAPRRPPPQAHHPARPGTAETAGLLSVFEAASEGLGPAGHPALPGPEDGAAPGPGQHHRRHPGHGAHHRRVGHGQVPSGPLHSRTLCPQSGALRQDQLRRPHGNAPGERTLRTPAGVFHRGHPGQEGQIRRGPRRLHLSRRYRLRLAPTSRSSCSGSSRKG